MLNIHEMKAWFVPLWPPEVSLTSGMFLLSVRSNSSNRVDVEDIVISNLSQK